MSPISRCRLFESVHQHSYRIQNAWTLVGYTVIFKLTWRYPDSRERGFYQLETSRHPYANRCMKLFPSPAAKLASNTTLKRAIPMSSFLVFRSRLERQRLISMDVGSLFSAM